MEKVLYLVLGAPGSGKSTFAKTLNGHVFEVDDYANLYNSDGTINLDLLPDAHQWCKMAFSEAAKAGEPCLVHTIITLNSPNTEYYIEVAESYDYRVELKLPSYGLLFYPHSFQTREAQIEHLIDQRKLGSARYVPEFIIRGCCYREVVPPLLPVCYKRVTMDPSRPVIGETINVPREWVKLRVTRYPYIVVASTEEKEHITALLNEMNLAFRLITRENRCKFFVRCANSDSETLLNKNVKIIRDTETIMAL